MSYRDERQSLEGPIDSILEGMEDFKNAAGERVKSEEWTREHKEELVALVNDFNSFELRLRELRRATW